MSVVNAGEWAHLARSIAVPPLESPQLGLGPAAGVSSLDHLCSRVYTNATRISREAFPTALTRLGSCLWARWIVYIRSRWTDRFFHLSDNRGNEGLYPLLLLWGERRWVRPRGLWGSFSLLVGALLLSGYGRLLFYRQLDFFTALACNVRGFACTCPYLTPRDDPGCGSAVRGRRPLFH